LIANILKDFIVKDSVQYGLAMKVDQSIFLRSGGLGMQKENLITVDLVCIYHLQGVISGEIQAVKEIKVCCVKPMKFYATVAIKVIVISELLHNFALFLHI
jgi:hypothetical protein